MHRASIWRILQRLKHKAASLHPSRALLHTHTDVTQMQTYTGYRAMQRKHKPSCWALQAKGPRGRPITLPVQVHLWWSIELMQHYYCAFLTKFNACLWAVVPHAAQCCSPSFSTHSQTALQHFKPPPSESLICLQRSAACCVYSLVAPPALIHVPTSQIVFPLLHESRSPSECTMKGNLHICVYIYDESLIHKNGWL